MLVKSAVIAADQVPDPGLVRQGGLYSRQPLWRSGPMPLLAAASCGQRVWECARPGSIAPGPADASGQALSHRHPLLSSHLIGLPLASVPVMPWSAFEQYSPAR
jgi:hypothetical protein